LVTEELGTNAGSKLDSIMGRVPPGAPTGSPLEEAMEGRRSGLLVSWRMKDCLRLRRVSLSSWRAAVGWIASEGRDTLMEAGRLFVLKKEVDT